MIYDFPMKPFFTLLLTITAVLPGFGQSIENPVAEPASTIFSQVRVLSDPAFGGTSKTSYVLAEKFWENEVKANPERPASWLNYYKAVRFKAAAMEQETFFRPRLDSIETQMSKQ